MTPQIDCLGKMSPTLRVSTHLDGVSKEIDWKMFIFKVNLGMWHFKSIISEKQALFCRFQHTFMGFLKEIDGKTFIFRVNLGMWPLKLIILEKQALFSGLQTHLWGFQQDRWEDMHVESKPRHVTPQIDCLRKSSPILSVSAHIYGVSKKIDGKMFMFNCCHFVTDHLYKYIHFTVYHIFLRYSTACSQNMF